MLDNGLLSFLARTDATSQCWLWQGGVRSDGYGQGILEGKWTHAHRISYLLFVGEIPDHLIIHHTCKVKNCVNPTHLMLVSRSEHRRLHLATHCKNGHEFSVLNTGWICEGKTRVCRTCRRAAATKFRNRQKETVT